jgi:ribose 5-phosphate isomerase B
MKKISIGCDHAGFQLKGKIIQHLQNKGYTLTDRGCYSEESVDYPDFAHAVADDLKSGSADLGVLICGSGNGISMAANKHSHVRAALSWLPEIASLARQHNNANVLSLPARFVSEELALQIVDAFFNAEFEGGRHARRVDKITCGA